MKSYLKIYLKFALFILISFTLISIIMATIISFIHMSNFIYHLLINLFAGIMMMIWGFLIVKTFDKKAIYHSLLCGLLFALMAIALNLDDLYVINIISRPFILIATVVILSFYKKRLEE